MKKIMLITSSGQIGGVEKISHTLWKELKKKDIEIIVIKIFKSNNEVFFYGKNEKVIFGNKVLSEKNIIKKMLRLLKDVAFISYYKKKYSIETSLAIGETCTIINGLTLTNDIKIGSIHGKKTIFKNILIKFISDISFKRTKKIICLSQGAKEELKNIFPEIKLESIYNPHDKNEILKKSKENLSTFEKKIFSKKVILYVGRVDKNKGISHLLKIFYKKQEELKEYNLVILGSIEEELEYKKIAKNVYFIDFVSNPYKYIKRAYCTVLTSYSEGLPNVLIESLILKVPIISTNSSKGIWEIMYEKTKNKEELQNGIFKGDVGIITPIFKYGDLKKEELSKEEEEFYDSIEIYKKNRSKYVGNIEKILKKFSKDVIVEKYLNIIKLKS
ncbi:MAG: glycosyltransferase [Cetobacterium sp.]|uniref:glycosyltransferase n=1 Tax=Cetobacterium sp. TaxID=2071632 RepID=UPI003EE54FD1